MVRKMMQLCLTIVGGVLGYRVGIPGEMPAMNSFQTVGGTELIPGQPYWFAAAGAVIGYVVARTAGDYSLRKLHQSEDRIIRLPVADLAAGITGMIIGLVIAALLYPAAASIGGMGTAVPTLLTLVLGYLGFRIGSRKKEEVGALITAFRKGPVEEHVHRVEEHKILDTSVIIDGRIADICKTGFIEGTLVIPEFVLEELQHIADSSDLLKRNRGRRGLDILNKIQKELEVKVLIYEGDFEDISEVDSKLVKLAKVLHGKVVTNDFNLNKVCELQGVSVLNINDLANAVKPVVLPGEEIFVQVIKDGKEHGQGVAYLDDGTMIVVEGGRDHIGSNLEVLVTSVLQTSAGRMIFAKPKLLEKAQ
ncbi:PIN/TRAM domain-containing protein [Paenibacillus turpanensis]|uniref:PIN/TRAM domain-containing protein n=1 Tax=Paenibacillus turpanensis TaxID=2689078 RepID=UPI00140D361F|nr:PIN/TRAM domain-containing protein [Paenibacillus turpanensis]